jgi:hypothetical protein
LTPWYAVSGALLFMFVCTYAALKYGKHETEIKEQLIGTLRYLKAQFYIYGKKVVPVVKELLIKVRLLLLRILASARN